MPEVSVIIPYFNKINTIERSVQSIICQTYKDWEIIIIDDHSERILDALASWNDLPIYVIRNETNLGPGKAREIGMRYAKGKYLAFLDADDWWHPDFLSKNLQIHESNPDISASWVKSELIYKDDKRELRKYCEMSFSNLRETLIQYARPWQTGGLLWKTKFCGSWGPLSTSEDHWFEFSSSINSNKVVHIPEVLYFVDRSADAERKEVITVEKGNMNTLELFLFVYDEMFHLLSFKYRIILLVRLFRGISKIKDLDSLEMKNTFWDKIETKMPWTRIFLRNTYFTDRMYALLQRTPYRINL